MNFAKAQLSKYGWQEGKGLGKDETGITQAIKPKLKFDNAGIGYDGAETFTYFWWQHAFNTASKNINVSHEKNDISLTASQDFDISTKKISSKRRKNLILNNFLKSETTLTSNGLVTTEAEGNDDVEGAAESNENVVSQNLPLTDEELFRACGGRTAHKGARHGLGLSGKLARIEEQERRLLSMTTSDPKVQSLEQKQKKYKQGTENSSSHEEQSKSDAHKKPKKKKSIEIVEDLGGNNHSERTKKRKKRKNASDALSDPKMLESSEVYESRSSTDQHEKKSVEIDDLQISNTSDSETAKRRKKKKRKDPVSHVAPDIESTTAWDSENNTDRHKKKRKSHSKEI